MADFRFPFRKNCTKKAPALLQEAVFIDENIFKLFFTSDFVSDFVSDFSLKFASPLPPLCHPPKRKILWYGEGEKVYE